MIGVPQANTNLSGVAGNLMTQPLQQGSFDGAARGSQAIGDSISGLGEVGQRISAVIQDANERKAKMQDDVSLATIDGLRSERLARYQGTLQGKSEDRWQPDWETEFASGDPKDLEGLPLSQDGRHRLALQTQEFMTRANTGLIVSSNRSAVDRGAGIMVSQAQRKFDDGDDAGGRVIVSQLVTNGAWRQDQADTFLKQVKETRNANELTGFMQSAPPQFADDMKIIKNGKDIPPHLQDMADHYFSGPDGRMKIDKWEVEAARNLRNFQIQGSNEIDDDILSGNITTEDQIHDRTAILGLGEKDARSFVDSLAVEKSTTPEGQAAYLAAYDQMWTESVNYDPSSDTDGQERMRILRDIRSQAIPGERQPLLTNLREAIKDGMTPQRERAANMENVIDTIGMQGLLIEKPKSKPEDDREAWAEYTIALNQKKAALKKSARDWQKKWPEPGPQDDADWMKSAVGSSTAGAAAKSMWQTPGNLWSSFMSRQTGGLGDFIPIVQLGRFQAAGIWGDKKTNGEVPSDAIRAKASKPQPQPTPATGGKLDSALIDAVKQWEGFSSGSYDDYKQTAIGYGTKGKPGETITRADADKRLTSELETHAARVDAQIAKSGISLNKNQRNALISFDFNTGDIETIMTSKSAEEIARRLPTWNKFTKGGKLVVSRGLINRRQKELEMFNS